jgi:integrase
VEEDRLGHAWELALSGLRREEIAGLRWADVDIEANTPSIVNNRVMAAGRSVENDPESMASRRTLPLPDRLVSGLAISQGASISVATGAWRGSFRLRGE